MSKIRHPQINRPSKVRYTVGLQLCVHAWTMVYVSIRVNTEQYNCNGLEISGPRDQRCGRGTVDANSCWRRRLCIPCVFMHQVAGGGAVSTAAVQTLLFTLTACGNDGGKNYCPTCPSYIQVDPSLSGLKLVQIFLTQIRVYMITLCQNEIVLGTFKRFHLKFFDVFCLRARFHQLVISLYFPVLAERVLHVLKMSH